MPDRYLANRTSEFMKNSEVYFNRQRYPISLGKPIFPRPQATNLLLGNMNMDRTLETHGAKDVTRCLHRADSQNIVLTGYGCAFQPAFCDIAGDRGCAR